MFELKFHKDPFNFWLMCVENDSTSGRIEEYGHITAILTTLAGLHLRVWHGVAKLHQGMAPHLDEVLPHLDEVSPHIDEVLPHLDEISPHLDEVLPH